MNHFFVCFGQLEGLLKSHRPQAPVYVQLFQETRGGQMGLTFEQHVIVVSDVQDGVCRYWRKRLSQSEYIGGRPMDPDESKRLHEAAHKVRDAIEKYIDDCGLSVQEAIVAMPRDLRVLDGEAAFLKFDKEQKAFLPA